MAERDLRVIKIVLMAKLDGLDLPAKFLLIRTIWRYDDSLVDATLGQLQAEVGMSRTNIIEARNTLLGARGGTAGDSGYIVEQYVAGRAAAGMGRIKGRPRRGFQLSPHFKNWVNERGAGRDPDLSLHDPIIRLLLLESAGQPGAVSSGVKGEAPDRSGAGGRLLLENRVLLALLWALADEHCAVRNMGATSLARMAGMTRDQFNSQLKKLMRLDYVRARIGGVSGSRLFGKSEGVIYLESLHPDLPCSHEGRSRQWVAMPSDEGIVGAINSSFRAADSIQRKVLSQERGREQITADAAGHGGGSAIKELWQVDEERLKGRIREFEWHGIHIATHGASKAMTPSSAVSSEPLNLYQAFTNTNLRERNYAHLVVCRYATELLQCNAKEILSGEEVNGEVLSDLQQEVCPRSKEKKQAWSMALAGCFYHWSRDLAAEALRWLAHQLDVCPEKLAGEGRFLLIPIAGQEAIGILVDVPWSLEKINALPVTGATIVSKSDS